MAEIKITARLDRVRDKRVQIYRLAAPKVTERTVQTVARSFGMRADGKSGHLCRSRDKIVYREGNLELAMYRASGGVRFRDVSRWQLDDGGPDFEMSDRQAHRRALAIADKYGLGAKDSRFLKAARLRVGEANLDTKEYNQRTIDVAVALERVIDGLPVDGPGGKTIVYMDRNGEPTGIERIWRDLDGVMGEGQLISVDAAIQELATQMRKKRGVIEISAVRLGYFEGAWHHRQRVLQPAYVLMGHTTLPESRVRRKIVYVAPALAKPAAPLTPRLRPRPRQPRRAAPKVA